VAEKDGGSKKSFERSAVANIIDIPSFFFYRPQSRGGLFL
jgi:hypothetical protein